MMSPYHKGLVPDDVVDFTEQVVDHIVVGFELTATLSEVNICEVNKNHFTDVYLNDLSLLYPPLRQVFISRYDGTQNSGKSESTHRQEAHL
jgi:hypothetical protein